MAAAAASIADAIEEVLDKIQESIKCQLPATKQDGGRGAPFLAVSWFVLCWGTCNLEIVSTQRQ